LTLSTKTKTKYPKLTPIKSPQKLMSYKLHSLR
jgi:hypothetical protein